MASVGLNELEHIFTQQLKLSEEEKTEVLRHFKEIRFAPKAFYLQEGEVCRAKAVIKQGAFKIFFTDASAQEHVLFFRFENMWLGDMESYHSGNPSRISIQALEESMIISINKRDFEKLELPHSCATTLVHGKHRTDVYCLV